MYSPEENTQWRKPVNRMSVGFFPTPLHRLNKLSEMTGYNLYLKRDDLSGFNAYGGNKIRKLEYLLGDAAAKGCDTVITYGATQSNHAMETISAARRAGLYPIVYLISLVTPDENDLRGNLLLDTLFDAEIHIVSPDGETMAQATERAHILAEKRIAQLEQEGHKCYDIPTGGATEVGSVGYITGYCELMDQMDALGEKPDYLFTATGTGGTLAGLTAGKCLRGDNVAIVGIQVSPKTDEYGDHVAEIANGALSCIGRNDIRVSTKDFQYTPLYFGAGYEIPFEEANETIRRLAKYEGVLMDTVYTGKGFNGMLRYLEEKNVPKGSTVVFLHTGGTTALFAEKEILGDLIQF